MIEGELEYPPVYPVAHLNREHSYSAHYELEEILRQIVDTYTLKVSPPITCIKRIIKKAIKPIYVKVIVGAVVAVSLIGVLAYTLAKSKN